MSSDGDDEEDMDKVSHHHLQREIDVGKLQPRCSISQFIRRVAFTVYHAAFFLEGRQSQVRITLASGNLSLLAWLISGDSSPSE